MKRDEPLRNISRHQYGTLKFINDNHVTLEYLRHAHATTLWSLLRWGWIAANGRDEKSEIVLTSKGREELQAYANATLAERAREADLTERCQRLLRHSRRLLTMPSSSKVA